MADLKAADLHYSLVIRWDPRDAIYVVDVPELPGCTTHGATYEEAIAQVQDAIETWVLHMDRAMLPAPCIYDDTEAIANA